LYIILTKRVLLLKLKSRGIKKIMNARKNRNTETYIAIRMGIIEKVAELKIKERSFRIVCLGKATKLSPD
jgi:hypothetical protein